MPKSKKAEEDKQFAITISLKLARVDDGEKVLLNQTLVYPTMTRVDVVLIQDVLGQMVVSLVDLAYASIEPTAGPEAAKFAAKMREVIRGELKK